MTKQRSYFSIRVQNGESVIQGKFWELKRDDQAKPPRCTLCSSDDAEYYATARGKKRRTEKQKQEYLTGLYQAKLLELEQEKPELVKSESFSVLAAKWLDHVREFRSAETAKIYSQSVRHYLDAAGDHPIEAFDHDFNTKFLRLLKSKESKRGGTLSVASQIKHIKAIQIFFGWAYRRDYLSRPIHLDKPQATKRPPEVYSISDLARLDEHILEQFRQSKQQRYKSLIWNHYRALQLATNLLLREGAIWSLKLENIDLNRRVIRIRHNPELKWRNKKGKEVDKPINADLFEFLTVDLEKRGKDERYYLDNGVGNLCYKNPGELSRAFGRYRDNLNLPERIKPMHGIRGAMITHLLASGVNIALVKELADHESIVTTESYANAKHFSAQQAVDMITLKDTLGTHN